MTSVESESKVAVSASNLIDQALQTGAVGVHIEPGSRLTTVRYRLAGGKMMVATKLPQTAAVQLASFFRRHSQLKSDRHPGLSSGQLEMVINDRPVSLEITLVPVIGGEKVILSLASTSTMLTSLDSLGLNQAEQHRLEEVLAQPYGLILLGGRQSRYISMLVGSLLAEFSGSAETPVWITAGGNTAQPSGIKTYRPRSETGFNAAHYLHTLASRGVRIIGVDYLLDKETIMAAESAARHSLIIAGVPAEGALATRRFVEQLAASSVVIRSYLRLVLASSYVDGLCPYCREKYRPSAIERRLFIKTSGGESLPPELCRPNIFGCEHCNYSGYSKIVGLFEWLEPEHSHPKPDFKKDAILKATQGAIDLVTLTRVVNN